MTRVGHAMAKHRLTYKQKFLPSDEVMLVVGVEIVFFMHEGVILWRLGARGDHKYMTKLICGFWKHAKIGSHEWKLL